MTRTAYFGQDDRQSINESHLSDLKQAASKMGLTDRRAFQAEMALKYCGGNPRQAETLFGWSRYSVELGLHEKRTGITCVGAHSLYGGNKRWEERHPAVAEALWGLAATHSQQDPTFRTTLSYTRLTAAEALKQLRAQGFAEDTLPCPSTLAEVLNRNGYRLRPVIKSKPKKKSHKPMPSSITCTPKTGTAATTARSSA